MTDIQTYNINNPLKNSPVLKGGETDQRSFELEAHTSKSMKVKRPKVSPNDVNIKLPVKRVFSDEEATKRMQAINTDIYEGAVKEKEKHEFNLKRYFTICGILALITAAITYLRKSK